MRDDKVHKRIKTKDFSKTLCGIEKRSNFMLWVGFWKDVTCKNCLKKKEAKDG